MLFGGWDNMASSGLVSQVVQCETVVLTGHHSKNLVQCTLRFARH